MKDSKSLARYTKAGQVQKIINLLTAARLRYCQESERDLEQLFLQQLAPRPVP